MMASEYIVNVSESDFEYEVINYSQEVPVVVDFWAEWCVPCKVLSPLLEKLAEEAQGAFRLAKVDVDENPKLAQRYGVRSIPAVKAFNQGQIVYEFVGALSEPGLKEFIRRLVPTPSDLLLEKGVSLLRLHQWSQAEKAFSEYLDQEPDNSLGLLGLAKSLLSQGLGSQASEILQDFPASREFKTAESLFPLARAFVLFQQGKLEGDSPLDAAFRNSIRLAGKGNILAALDGLLDILRQKKHYRDDQARMVVLALLELLGEEDPQTREYRQELATVLF